MSVLTKTAQTVLSTVRSRSHCSGGGSNGEWRQKEPLWPLPPLTPVPAWFKGLQRPLLPWLLGSFVRLGEPFFVEGSRPPAFCPSSSFLSLKNGLWLPSGRLWIVSSVNELQDIRHKKENIFPAGQTKLILKINVNH